jgi:hypothetical protein
MNEKNEQMNEKKKNIRKKNWVPNFRLRMRAPEGTTMVDIAQFPVAHAQNILPVM